MVDFSFDGQDFANYGKLGYADLLDNLPQNAVNCYRRRYTNDSEDPDFVADACYGSPSLN